MTTDNKIKFSKGKRLFATRCCEGYSASDSSSSDNHFTLWVHRHPFSSSAHQTFLNRVEIIANSNLPISHISGFGIDERGHGWIATSISSLESLLIAEKSSLEKNYVRALQIVGALHEKGVVIGDICDHSFMIDSEAGTLLQAFLGEFDIEVQKTAKIPPKETFYYLAPEQRTASVNTYASDIYSLGVLGYKLFTNDYPSASGNPLEPTANITSVVPPPSVISKESPVWLDDVLGTCLEQKAENRYKDASELVNVIRDSLESGQAPGGASRWSKKTVLVNSQEILSSLNAANAKKMESAENTDSNAFSQNQETREMREEKKISSRVPESSSEKSKTINKDNIEMTRDKDDFVGELPAGLRTGVKAEDVKESTRNLLKSSFKKKLGMTSDDESPVLNNVDDSIEKDSKFDSMPISSPEENIQEEEPSVLEESEAGNSKSITGIFYFLSFFTGILLLGVLFLLLRNVLFKPSIKPTGSFASNLEVNEDLAPASLRPSLNDLKSASVSLDVKKAALKRIGESEDDFAFNVLVSVVKSEGSSELGITAWTELMNQLKKRDLKYSAKILNNWYQGMLTKGINPTQIISKVLKVVDKSLPLSSRKEELKSIFSKSPNLALQYAAALSLDTKGDKSFTPLLRSFLKEKRGQTDLEGKSIYGIILSDKNLMYQFEGDMREFLKDFSDNDLAWGMSFLANQNSLLLKDVAAETLSRDIVPKYKREFVKTMSRVDHFELSKNLKMALVRGAKGESKIEDISVVGNWYNTEAERLLLVLSATSESEKMRKAAFTKLSKKSMSREPSRSLVSWVKRNKWKKRGKIARPIAILSLQDIASEKEVEDSFNKLVPYFGNGSIYELFNKIGEKKLSYMALDKVGLVLPDDVLLELLTDSQKNVRIKAVEALKDRNGLHLLQAINKAYEREKDPEVRKVYEEVHWVARDRSKR